jgi:hypothetical protein
MSKTLKIGIIILVILCVALLAVTFLDIPSLAQGELVLAQTESTPVPQESSEVEPDLVAAVMEAVDKSVDSFDAELYIIDNIQFQDDGQVAAVWLAALDPETGESIGREPDLVMAQMDAEGNWQVLTDDESKFTDVLTNFQYADKSIQGDITEDPEPLPKDTTVYGGYYLPWAEGLTKRLTWSVGHTSCYPIYYCTHAFDFADGTMFPIVAAKGGFVYHWKDTCANGDSSCTNSITLQDRSTTPWTYQIYLHIAQGSVPSSLKQVGKTVLQGQYIANVDDTGYSTGHHVHFMVVSEDTKYISTNGYVWGVALDITYKDVSINWDSATQGGRPRLAYEAEEYGGEGQTYYTSGNAPANPPTGALTAPLTKTYITDPMLTVSGWGRDDVSVTKYEILAKYDGDWVTIGEKSQTTSPFTTTIDLCETDIPDGPFTLALRVWDYEGSPSGILSQRELIKGVECTSGVDPDVTLTTVGGDVLLPKSGQVSATVTKGSTNSDIASVDFWFHGTNWNGDSWILLGTDTDDADGWQVPFEAGTRGESNAYTVLAVATDGKGNQGTDLTFSAVLDKTEPWIEFDPIHSPVAAGQVSITWTSGDQLTGIDHYVLDMKVNDGEWQILESSLSRVASSYEIDVNESELIIIRLTVSDKAGNVAVGKTAFFSDGYVFPNSYLFPTFMGDD